MRRSSRSRSRRSRRSSSQRGWFIVGFRQNQSWIILALSRATIDSDMRVSSRQHCSSCTVMCHCWQTAACPRLVSISSSLACQPWVYCVTVYCVDGWLISRRISKMYPRELCHLTKGFTPIKAMSFNGKNEGVIRCDPFASQKFQCFQYSTVPPVIHHWWFWCSRWFQMKEK